MAKNKPVKDKHTSRQMVRIPPEVHQQLKLLAKKNNRPMAWELRAILVEHLEKSGLWPPK